MNLKTKIMLAAVLLVAMLAMAGCGSSLPHYGQLDANGYNVSVKFDANGGVFTTNTSVIVDSFALEALPVENGKAQVALLTPDNAARGNDAFTAVNNGYFLAGWYAQRTETQDENGNTVYTYGEKWDFETSRLSLDPNGSYSAAEPQLTLYAAWVPLFEIEIYDRSSGAYINSLTFDPANGTEFTVPAWDEKTGAMEMYDFPQYKNHTFDAAYLDQNATEPVGQTIVHPGTVDYESGVGKDTTMKLYVDWLEGEWFHIYHVEQFLDHASVNGNYVLHSDLDFSDAIWPTSMMYGNFAGTIVGNGHTISNVSIVQNNNSKTNAGLFGYITEKASITDVTFRNVTFTIKAGTRVAGAAYGLFAGTIAENAEIRNVSILESKLQIDSDCYFGTNDYTLGLVCGMGDSSVITDWQVTCVAVGKDPESVSFTVDGNTVTIQ